MLNTDAHNPNVKTKMSFHQFLKNNRGIDSSNDLSVDFLSKLYYSVVLKEIKMGPSDFQKNGEKLQELQMSLIGSKLEVFNYLF